MASTVINVRVDSGVKREAQEILNILGLDMSTAINVFLRQVISVKGLPFEVVLRPNTETLMAMAEVEEMKEELQSKS